MTHFQTIVLVPKEVWAKGEGDIEQYIDYQMAPFIETGTGECEPEYMVFEATHKKRNFLKDAKKILAELRKEKPIRKDILEKYLALFKKKKYEDMFKDWEGGEIGPNGDFGHNSNPNSFYDYYSIGGRWNGVIIGAPRSSEDGFNFGPEYKKLRENTVRVKDLLTCYRNKQKELEPFFEAKNAIADIIEDKDGTPWSGIGYALPFREFFKGKEEKEWANLYKEIGQTIAKGLRGYHDGIFYNEFLIMKIVADRIVYECEDVGWWGMSTPKKSHDEWIKEYEELLEKHRNDYAVALDCHV